MSTIKTWRICSPRYADSVYSGEGARIHGGRWNSRGRPVVYSSESIALAVLEQLVHVEEVAALSAFVAISAALEEELVEALDLAALPRDWRTYPAPAALKAMGDAGLSGNRSLALRVPSVTVSGQYNYLINPAHPDFASVEISDSEPLNLDPRITGIR